MGPLPGRTLYGYIYKDMAVAGVEWPLSLPRTAAPLISLALRHRDDLPADETYVEAGCNEARPIELGSDGLQGVDVSGTYDLYSSSMSRITRLPHV